VTGLTEEIPVVRTEIDTLESRMDRVDVEILTLVRERIALAEALRAARAEAGGTRFVHERELAAVRRFAALGPAGAELAATLLRLCG